MIAWALLTRMLGSGKIVKMIQISNPFWHFSGKFSAIILSERRRKNIAQLLNITSFSAPTFVLSVPFSVWVLFTPFPGMSVSFLKLSGIISAVSGDTGVSILSPPQLASDKHFLPRTSLSSNVPVLSSTRWSNQQPSNRQQPRTPFLWAFLMSQIFRQNSKFHVGLWPPRSVLLRETSRMEKNSPQPLTIALHFYPVSKIIKMCLLSQFCLKQEDYDDKGWEARAVHGRWRVDDGPADVLMAADNGRSYFWSQPGLGRVWPAQTCLELWVTRHSQPPATR